jgi:demethoxyubiquinone hydroxylase (CLK1/Coq7/Cat5 family)
MKKLLIHATKELATKLEEKLRQHYDIQLDILDEHDDKNKSNVNVCEIKVKIRKDWVTLCRFAPNENLKDILTMFQVNYELKARRRDT